MANILEEVQQEVAAKLSADQSLSSCQFLVENRKDIDYEIKNALGRQGIVGVVMTPKAVYAGKYEDLFLAWQLDELEIDIVENVTVNRGKRDGYITGQDAAMRLFDVLCPLSGDYEGQFNPVSYEEGEDSGLIVNRCVLKALVYGEHGDTPQPEPPLNMTFVKLLDGPPTKPPHDGWMWPTEDGFVLWQNGQAHKLGGVTFDEMSAYVDSATSSFLSAEDVYVGSVYWTTHAWKAVEDTAVKMSNGNLFLPDGSVFALSRLELDVDGSVSYAQLSAAPQFAVDGIGNFTYLGMAYTTIPQPFYFQTADGTRLELIFKVDGDGTYSVQVVNPEGWAIAEQPDHEPVPDCDLEFDYGESHCKVRATNAYSKASDLNNFVREFLGLPDDGSTVPTTSQLMELSASLETNYVKRTEVQPATYQNVYPAFAQNAVAAAKLNAFDTQSLAMTEKASFNAYVTYNQSSNTYDLVLKGEVAVPNYWNIENLFGETFSPALKLSWRRSTIYRKRVIGGTTRWSITYTGWMWLLEGRYAMTASADGEEDGKLYVLNYEDETHPNYINNPATDIHTLTFSMSGFIKNIATVDGQTGQATADRNTVNNIVAFTDNLAYVYQLSDYLPLSGGTLSGDLSVGSAAIKVYDGFDSVQFYADHMNVRNYHIDYPPAEGTLATTQDIFDLVPYTFAEADLQAPAIELLNRTNTIVSAQQGTDINLTFDSTGDGKMSDMWLNVCCPLSVTSELFINWPHSAVPKDGDYDNLSVQLSAWNTYMIVEKRPGTFMVARTVEDIG